MQGKTTVAELLAAAMVELGYRKNPKPVLTSANDILSEQDPPAAFEQLVMAADGGTLFIVRVALLCWSYQSVLLDVTVIATRKVDVVYVNRCNRTRRITSTPHPAAPQRTHPTRCWITS